MRIAFITPRKANLPELYAYRQYFESKGIGAHVFSTTPSLKELADFSVEWHMMGLDRLPKHPSRIKIHEYTSVSTPPLAQLKNRIKQHLTIEPDYRIFKNAWVAREMNLSSKPFIYRDQGVDESFIREAEKSSKKKEYDFVYIGSFEKNRKLKPLIFSFLRNFSEDYNFLLIGKIPDWLKNLDSHRLKLVESIPYWEIPNWLHKSEYGINYIIDKYPFNRLTSTKLLEYCAADLKIVSTSYLWVNNFEKKYGGHFYKIKEDGSNFHPEKLKDFQFSTPDLSDLSWDSIFSSNDFQKLLNWIGVKA